MKQSQLPRILADSFNEAELRLLLFEVGLEYDSFGGAGNMAKAREIVAHFIRRNELPILIGKIVELRPNCFKYVSGRESSLPSLPTASKENGDEAFYRFLRDTLYRVEQSTAKLKIYVAISIAMSLTNFVLILVSS